MSWCATVDSRVPGETCVFQWEDRPWINGALGLAIWASSSRVKSLLVGLDVAGLTTLKIARPKLDVNDDHGGRYLGVHVCACPHVKRNSSQSFQTAETMQKCEKSTSLT